MDDVARLNAAIFAATGPPALDCPDPPYGGHGRMGAEATVWEGGSTYDVPGGPAWRLTCPVCGWEVWVDRLGLPFWKQGRLKMWKRRADPPYGGSGVHEEDVRPESYPEVARRINVLQQLRGTAAAHRGWGGRRKDGQEVCRTANRTADATPAAVTQALGLEDWEDE